MPWTLEPDRDAVRLTLSEQVDVVEAADLHRVLTELVHDRRGVAIDMSACAAIDCTTLQLLLAFRHARASGGASTTVTVAPGPVADTLRRLGLQALIGARA